MSQLNINVAILGSVSSGKSTLLNSLFLEEFTTMKIHRNTMIPQIYTEVINNKSTIIKNAKTINAEISESNEKILDKSKDPNYNIQEDFKEIKFDIHKLKELNFLKKDLNFSFYDIPGLNDVKNHDIYFKYVKKNFNKFDVILYLINLESGLNTTDEINILNFICKNMSKSNPKFVIPIINKSDNMTMENGVLLCDNKYTTNCEHIKNILSEYIGKYNINQWFAEPVLYSAQEAFMYRILQKNPNYELSIENQNIIGFNEMGKKYYALSNEDRIEKVKTIIKENKFNDTMVRMTGYNDLFDGIKNILSYSNQQILCTKKITDSFTMLKESQPNTSNILNIYNGFEIIYEQSKQLTQIFDCVLELVNKIEFAKSIFDNVVSNVKQDNIDELVQLKTCIDTLANHKYSEIIKFELINAIELVKDNIYSYYVNYYNKYYTFDDLIYVLEQLESNNIVKSNDFTQIYLDYITTNKIDFYKSLDLSNYRSIVDFDSQLKSIIDKLKSHIDSQLLRKIYNYVVKNKIKTLITHIKSNNQSDTNMAILYNLMLFYNFNSTKNIEYSEIYTLLLSNYIGLIGSMKFDSVDFNNDSSLYQIDNDYANIESKP